MRNSHAVSYILATGFGSGLSPFAPGTAGSAFAIVFVWFMYPSAWWAQVLLAAAASLVGVWVSAYVSSDLGKKDPSMVVIDEIAGVLICFIGVPINLWTLLVGFLLFRLFDIWKPGPIGYLESCPGGWGIMLDDMLAGVFVNICFQVMLFWNLF